MDEVSPTCKICGNYVDTPMHELGCRGGDGVRLVACIHSVPTKGCPVCGGAYNDPEAPSETLWPTSAGRTATR